MADTSADSATWTPEVRRGAIAFFSWLVGPLLVPATVGVAALLDQPAGLAVGGLAALWWSGCLVLLVRHVARGDRPRPTRPSREGLLSRIVWRVLWWLVVGCIWAVTASCVTLTVALQKIPTRDGGTPLDFDHDGSLLIAVGEGLGWAAFGLAAVGPVVAWVTAPRDQVVSDPPPPAGP